MGFLQRHEKRVVRQPAAVFLAEPGVVLRRVLGKAAVGAAQHVIAQPVQPAVIHRRFLLTPGQGFIFRFLQQTLLFQQVQVDKIRVARHRRKGLVGGIAEAGRPDGQKLPPGLPGPLQKIDKAVGTAAHGADAVRPRQGRKVHQNSAGSHKKLSFSMQNGISGRVCAAGRPAGRSGCAGTCARSAQQPP